MWLLSVFLFHSNNFCSLYLKFCWPFIVMKFSSWSLKYTLYNLETQIYFEVSPWHYLLSYFIIVPFTSLYLYIYNGLIVDNIQLDVYSQDISIFKFFQILSVLDLSYFYCRWCLHYCSFHQYSFSVFSSPSFWTSGLQVSHHCFPSSSNK